MRLEITATGEALRYIDANARVLGLTDPDLIGPDPVAMLCRFVNLGFGDLADPSFGPSSAIVQSSRFDADRAVQQWLLEVSGLDEGLLRVLSNLLRAMGTDSVHARAVASAAAAQAFDVASLVRLPYPSVAPPLGVLLDYTPPDPDDIVRSRHLQLALPLPTQAEVLRRLCDELDVWMEVVCRSGYCPADVEPAQAGAMPAFAFAQDPYTVAVEFDGFFRADEACFAAIASYTHRLARQGMRVQAITVQ